VTLGYKLGKGLRKGAEAVTGSAKKAIKSQIDDMTLERQYRSKLRKKHRRAQIRKEVAAEFKKPKKRSIEDMMV